MSHIILDRFHSYLQHAGRSRTQARDAVFLALFHLERCRPRELRRELMAGQLDRVTLYRTIRFLVDIGAAHELANGMIELSDRFKQHHHHFSCRVCGRETTFRDEQLEAALNHVGRDLGLELESHQVELTGRCPSCLATEH